MAISDTRAQVVSEMYTNESQHYHQDVVQLVKLQVVRTAYKGNGYCGVSEPVMF